MTDTRGTFRLKNVRQDVLNNEYVPIPSVWVNTPSPGVKERWFDSASAGSNGVEFDGSDYLQIASSSDLSSGTNDFTFEAWVYSNSGTSGSAQCIYDNRSGTGSNTTGIFLGRMSAHSGKVEVYSAGDYRNANGAAFTENEWHHVAVVRESNVIKLYLDGTQSGDSYSTSNNYSNTTARIGSGVGGADKWQGKISNVRFINGRALYTSNFDRPTSILTNVSDTKLLCCQSSSSTTTKEVGPTITANGDPTAFSDINLPINQPPAATPTSSSTNLGVAEKGYIAGGYGNVSSISKLDMASETYTRLTASLSETNRRLGGFGDLTKGYAAGSTQPVRSWCQKLVYSTETRTTLTSQMQAARGYLRAIGNNTAGYVGGGTPQSSQGTKMDKMPYSNETFSSLPNIPTSRYRYASLGNQDKGYFAGGYPNAMSKVTKITYSNDSYATTPTLSYAATFQTGAGNATKGYVVSGEGGGTKVDKITFSNDTPARVPSADLSAVRYAMDGNNSPTKAYFTGGSPGVKTNTEIITFANDTTALSSTANADTGDNQAGAYAAFGPNHCGNPGSDFVPNVI
tara:strand:- start:43 stop:1752 length:1710 start_codon:yes stop_codon:yes gene_type:complete